MLSSIATHDPLPLVPATVMTLYGGGLSFSRSSKVTTRSSVRSIFFGCSVSNHESQRSSVKSRRDDEATPLAPGSGQSGFCQQLGKQCRNLIARLTAVKDHVDRAFLEQELGALEALGQRLARGLLDHARTRETDQRAGLCDVDVAEQREARRYTAGGGVRHDRDIRQLGGRELR